jgi:hypothetical protein
MKMIQEQAEAQTGEKQFTNTDKTGDARSRLSDEAWSSGGKGGKESADSLAQIKKEKAADDGDESNIARKKKEAAVGENADDNIRMKKKEAQLQDGLVHDPDKVVRDGGTKTGKGKVLDEGGHIEVTPLPGLIKPRQGNVFELPMEQR